MMHIYNSLLLLAAATTQARPLNPAAAYLSPSSMLDPRQLSALGSLLSLGSSGKNSTASPTVPAAPASSGFDFVSLLAKVAGAPQPELGSVICTLNDPENPGIVGSLVGSAFGSAVQPGEKCALDTDGGSGPYKAHYIEDPSLPGKTIYVPKTPPPADKKLPVIVWGNGACIASGTMFSNFLTEIASHGFFIIANGGARTFGMSSYKDLISSVDWVTKDLASIKHRYGNVNINKITVSGQSCGGTEAYSAVGEDSRIKHTVLFNSGNLNPLSSVAASIKVPVAIFNGGPDDIAHSNGIRDFGQFKVPALLAEKPVGHLGTYYVAHGGAFGAAAVKYFSWQLGGDESLKPLFCNNATSTLVTQDKWNIQTKNGFC